MKKIVFALSVSIALAAVAYDVDVFIGTAGNGHVTPAATTPFALVQAGPDTTPQAGWYSADWAHCSGYQRTDPFIWRFSQTHLSGTGCCSCGDFGFLPYLDEPTNGVYVATKDQISEKGEPGYYAVSLNGGSINVEIAAAPHSAAYRFRYPKGARAKLIVDLDHGANGHTDDVKSFYGFTCQYLDRGAANFPSVDTIGLARVGFSWSTFRVFACAVFSRPIVSRCRLSEAKNGRGEIWSLDFGEVPDGALEMRLALSTTSEAAAAKNLAAEMPMFDFDGVRQRAGAVWKKTLSRVELDASADPAIAASFKAAFYRTCFQPNDIGDVGKPFYSTFSLWDTFRAAHPWYTIAVPERVDAFIRSMLVTYQQNGYLPIWGLWGTDNQCMIGHHAVPVIADAYLKGFRGFDVPLAFEAITNSLNVCHKAVNYGTWGITKEDWPVLNKYGYYPFDGFTEKFEGNEIKPIVGESVSRLLECNYDDACAARLAKALGKKEAEEFFGKRSSCWRNVYNPELGIVCGRDKSGAWRKNFDPFECGHCAWSENDFTEGNAWQYTWHVMQDPKGLVELMGGPKKAGERLDAIFKLNSSAKPGENGWVGDVTGLIGQYAHGNEPSHHIAYFYAFTDRPERTAEVVREVFDTQYFPKDDGLCGNDDCGQMAAWYLFSALGFYPFDPCGGEYVIGAPQIPGAKISLPGGKTFTMKTKNFRRGGKLARVLLNGKPLDGFVVRHGDIMSGATIEFEFQ